MIGEIYSIRSIGVDRPSPPPPTSASGGEGLSPIGVVFKDSWKSQRSERGSSRGGSLLVGLFCFCQAWCTCRISNSCATCSVVSVLLC